MATTRLGFFGAWAAYLGFTPKGVTEETAPVVYVPPDAPACTLCPPSTLADLRREVLTWLGDLDEQVWTGPEVTLHLVNGYQQLATAQRLFWDWIYLENLPRGFNYTQPWERAFVTASGGFDFGVANYTFDDERRMWGDERLRLGPANYTSPFEATDGHLSHAAASTDIPATADLPKTVASIDRVTWDNRGIDALTTRAMERMDARYEFTRGEVYGFLWQKDGIRTLRKVRVPAAQAATVAIEGAWGLLRSAGALNSVTSTGSWGLPRQVPSFHPIGTERFGAPRRPYLDGTNVRVEHHRLGRALSDDRTIAELPCRYTSYLQDYALSQLYARNGPGQDPKLAKHFADRWTRDLQRIANRIDRMGKNRTPILGGDGRSLTTRPPRPQLPWAYGSRVR